MEASVIGIDLAKSVFHACAVDEKGKELWNQRLSRAKMRSFLAKNSASTIAMEACGGAHYWGREARSHGCAVRLIAPQFVKPFSRGQKNDYRDAQAICEASLRPQMRFTALKSVADHDIQSTIRHRDLLVSQRTMLLNHARGILAEYGIVLAKGAPSFRKNLSGVIESGDVRVTIPLKRQMELVRQQLVALDDWIAQCEANLDGLAKQDPLYTTLQKLPGVGKLTAAALLPVAGHAKQLRNGRQFSASLGLVPRQNSSGGKSRLLGITKTGDRHLRKLLIHGARAVLRHTAGKTDPTSVWLQRLVERRGRHKAMVALANKNARTIWAIITKQDRFVW